MKARLVAAGALVAGAAMFTGGALSPLRNERPASASAPVDVDPAGLVVPGAGASTDNPVAALAARVEADPSNAEAHAQLGLAYLQRARDDADPAALPLAERALTRSLELQPRGNLEAFLGMAALANARHEFAESIAWSRRAIASNPYDASGYGLLGDASFELGRVGAADAAYQKMVDVRPDVASYVRASYALQYHGRTKAAIGVMRLALKAAGPNGETAAWVRHQMGDVYAGLGDNRRAARQNRIGIALAPGYAPPMVGLAEAHIAKGRLEQATEIVEAAVAELPALEYLIALGDLYRATGRHDDARAQYRVVADKLGEYRHNGVLPDADFVVFYADQGIRSRAALREAFAIYRDRPTAKTADALGWMLHSLGRDRAAWRFATEAVRAEPRDALTSFHAGVIARSLGRDAAAVRLARAAITLDPSFSVIHAPTARRMAGRA
ncbi:MAG TPA: hypothetical protein VEU29_03335 [Actinomycetota bacterium]|nr:hypothetical protein [Actinomycetota bacterium]